MASSYRIGPIGLLSESSRIAASSPVASVVALLIVASVSGLILATTGQTVSAEQEVLSRIDDAGTRLILVTDVRGDAGLNGASVERIAALSNVEWVVGFGFSHDARNSNIGAGAQPVPARHLVGQVPPAIRISGVVPPDGGAIVGREAARALGLQHPAGSIDVDSDQFSVVGSFVANDPLAGLDGSVLVLATSDRQESLRSIYAVARRPSDVASLELAIWGVLGDTSQESVHVETSAALAELRAAVQGELGAFSRGLILALLGVGLLLVALVAYGSVTIRGQDFGRRRALGASRSAILSLVALQYTQIALAGACLGVAAGTYFIWRWTGGPPEWRFTASIVVLTMLTTLIAALLPAVIAAIRDPVSALRVP